MQQQLNAGHAKQEVKLAELELRCTQLEQEAEGVKATGEKFASQRRQRRNLNGK